jgi:ferritin-like metal-binding protein YciE
MCRFMANKLEEFKGLDELLSFLTRFLASPDYVKNPYLRAKIVRHHTHTHDHTRPSEEVFTLRLLRSRWCWR